MSELKTLPNEASAEDFINAVDNETKKQDSLKLLRMFVAVTGEKPVMWGASIIGFGKYHYKSDRSSQEGVWPLIGFSPRKQNLTLYIMEAGRNHPDLMGSLGKHKTSKGCLYINKLDDVDLTVLENLIKATYLEAKRKLT